MRRGWDSNPHVLADSSFQDWWNSRYPTSPDTKAEEVRFELTRPR